MTNYKYHTHVEPNFEFIRECVKRGMTDEEIAFNLDIAYSTFRRYVNEYPELRDLMKRTKEIADLQVENALFKRSIGFTYEEEVLTAEGKETITRYEIPHPSSAMFWLRNRQGDKWRNTEKAQYEKVLADKKYIEAKTKLLEAVEQDSELLQALALIVGGSGDKDMNTDDENGEGSNSD